MISHKYFISISFMLPSSDSLKNCFQLGYFLAISVKKSKEKGPISSLWIGPISGIKFHFGRSKINFTEVSKSENMKKEEKIRILCLNWLLMQLFLFFIHFIPNFFAKWNNPKLETTLEHTPEWSIQNGAVQKLFNINSV